MELEPPIVNYVEDLVILKLTWLHSQDIHSIERELKELVEHKAELEQPVLLSTGYLNQVKSFAQDVMARKFCRLWSGNKKDFQIPQLQVVSFVIKPVSFRTKPDTKNLERKSAQDVMGRFYFPRMNGQLKAFQESQNQNASFVLKQGSLILMNH